ncbi:metallophosphoesterase [[Eubacterium] cellulosolvens]
MIVLVLTDIHRSQNAARQVAHKIVEEHPDAIFIAGDISHGSLNEAINLLQILNDHQKNVFFVPGNMDSPELMNWNERNIKSLHGRCESFDNYSLIGAGGSVYTPFNTHLEFAENEIAETLRQAFSKCIEKKNMILISHCPPKDTKLDRTSTGIHAGSKSVRQFIESKKPLLVVTGHIHEARGIDKIGETIIVNPGPAHLGRYAIIEFDEQIQVELK